MLRPRGRVALFFLCIAACGDATSTSTSTSTRRHAHGPLPRDGTGEDSARQRRPSPSPLPHPSISTPFTIVLHASGRVRFAEHAFDLGSRDPGEADDGLQALWEALCRHGGRDPTLREKRGPLQVPILLVYERRTPIKWLLWILHALEHPDIKAVDVRIECREALS